MTLENILSITAWGLFILVLFMTLLRKPWKQTSEHPVSIHQFMFSAIILAMLWSMKAGLTPAMEFHFLAMTLTTLMLGPDLAIMAGILAWCLRASLGFETWHDLATESLIWIILPSWLTYLIHKIVAKYLPFNYFIYFFITGYLGAMICAAFTVLVWGGFQYFSGHISEHELQSEFILLIPLMLFGEGFINGLNLAIFVVYRPEWVQSFDDKLYLPFKKEL